MFSDDDRIRICLERGGLRYLKTLACYRCANATLIWRVMTSTDRNRFVGDSESYDLRLYWRNSGRIMDGVGDPWFCQRNSSVILKRSVLNSGNGGRNFDDAGPGGWA